MSQTSILRRELKQKRSRLSPAEQRKASKSVIKHLSSYLRFRRSKHIASYWPNTGEIDLRNIRLKSDQTLYLPALQEQLRPWCGRGLLFVAETNSFRKNRFGIPEPTGKPGVNAAKLDCLLIPLVGFDRAGNRIGMGGGYYDRALAKLSVYRPTFKLGVAYSFQEIDGISPQPWDIPLDGVVTEKELLLFKKWL